MLVPILSSPLAAGAQERETAGDFWMAGGAAAGIVGGQGGGIGGFLRTGATVGDGVGLGLAISTFAAEEDYHGPLDYGPITVRRTDVAGSLLYYPLGEALFLKGSLGVAVIGDDSGEGMPATASLGLGFGFEMPMGGNGLYVTPGVDLRLHPGVNAPVVGLMTLGIGFR